MFVFENWKIYKDARELRQEIKKITKQFPNEEKFVLTDQINRASLSVILQIAEGSNRKTSKDKALFYNRSHTSVDEIIGCIDAALDSKYINDQEYQLLYNKCESIAKQFRGLAKYLKNK